MAPNLIRAPLGCSEGVGLGTRAAHSPGGGGEDGGAALQGRRDCRRDREAKAPDSRHLPCGSPWGSQAWDPRVPRKDPADRGGPRHGTHRGCSSEAMKATLP